MTGRAPAAGGGQCPPLLLQYSDPLGHMAGDDLQGHRGQGQPLQKSPVGRGGEGVLVVEAHPLLNFNHGAVGRAYLPL